MSTFQPIDLLQKMKQLIAFSDRYNSLSINKRTEFCKIPFDKKYIYLGTSRLYQQGIVHNIDYVAGAVPVWTNMLNDIEDIPYSNVAAKYESDLKANYQDYLDENKLSDPDYKNMYRSNLTVMINSFDKRTSDIDPAVHEVADFITLRDAVKELDEGVSFYA